MNGFSTKERERFRKLLEVAHSSTFPGERDAALAAAARLAATHGMTLREAAGMAESDEPRAPRRPAGFPHDFGAMRGAFRAQAAMRRGHDGMYGQGVRMEGPSEDARYMADKQRYDQAMADAVRRGLDADERAKAATAAKRREFVRRPNRRAFRDRADFIRVLLRETSMSARDIAATVGVTIYDVFREKLLMRRKAVAG